MAVIPVEQKRTLRMVNATETKVIREWEHLYPDLWLFIGVTHEDEGEVRQGKLVATAEDPSSSSISTSHIARAAPSLSKRAASIPNLSPLLWDDVAQLASIRRRKSTGC